MLSAKQQCFIVRSCTDLSHYIFTKTSYHPILPLRHHVRHFILHLTLPIFFRFYENIVTPELPPRPREHFLRRSNNTINFSVNITDYETPCETNESGDIYIRHHNASKMPQYTVYETPVFASFFVLLELKSQNIPVYKPSIQHLCEIIGNENKYII